jgi:hypothetical protein
MFSFYLFFIFYYNCWIDPKTNNETADMAAEISTADDSNPTSINLVMYQHGLVGTSVVVTTP